jgi:hypothetical protein
VCGRCAGSTMWKAAVHADASSSASPVSVKKSQLQPGGKMLVRWSLGVSEDPASLVASMTAPPPTPGIQTLTLGRETLP